jgi:APA family basic amino acid/polyamine antiporter
MGGLFVKKDLARLIADANDPNAGEGGHGGGGLKRTLGAFNLTMLGIGAIIGAGIFSLTGTAAANYAGPGIVYSFVIGGILCALAGLCYAEMAAMIPVAGSAYAYSYATMGEFIAWIIGWDLVLEYAFGAVTVSVAWSGYLMSLLHKTLHLHIPDAVWIFTKGPWETVTLNSGQVVHGVWNIPATVVSLAVASILFRGMKESAFVNNLIVVTKVTIVLIFIILGIGMINTGNLFVNSATTGLGSLVPAQATIVEAGKEVTRYGWMNGGVLTGAGVVFFAYIGFDAVSTTAQEAKNPKRDLPIGIMASLIICTVLYILVALTLTGVVPYKQLGVPDPIAVGIDKIVELRGWSMAGKTIFTFFIKLGALAGLTSVILVMMMGQTRVFYAMSKDGLLPWFGATHKEHHTPHVATVVTGIFVAVAGGALPMSLVGELVSIGTLLAFVLVCIGVPILRASSPNIERPFQVPMPWVVGIVGALACLWVMSGLPEDTWLRLFIWLYIGLATYFFYGRRNSTLQKEGRVSYGPLERDILGMIVHLFAMGGLVWVFTAYKSLRFNAAAWRAAEALPKTDLIHLVERYSAHDILFFGAGFLLLAIFGVYLIVSNKPKAE